MYFVRPVSDGDVSVLFGVTGMAVAVCVMVDSAGVEVIVSVGAMVGKGLVGVTLGGWKGVEVAVASGACVTRTMTGVGTDEVTTGAQAERITARRKKNGMRRMDQGTGGVLK